MPKTKFQEVIFTIMMVFVMVYAMICYNIALNVGGLNTSVFLSAFHEFVIMAPVAFVLDFFFVGHIAKRTAFRIVNPEKENPFHLVIAISVVSVAWMWSAYEPCSDNLIQRRRKPVYRSMAADYRAELSDGVLLADVICRTVCTLSVQTDIPRKRKSSCSRKKPLLIWRGFSILTFSASSSAPSVPGRTLS